MALTDREKLDQIAAIIQSESAPAAAAQHAYDLPPIPASDASLVMDSRTFNKDGSLWTKAPPFGGGEPVATCIAFGYISPTKTPEIWRWAEQNMTPEGFAEFDARWKSNPYGVYRADPRDLINKGVVNLVSFGYLVQPFATFQQ